MAELKVKARLAFVQLHEPREFNGQKNYSVTLLIPHKNENAVKKVNEAIKKLWQKVKINLAGKME